jgi:hypothetical protein
VRPLQLNRPANVLTPSDTVTSVLLTTSAQAFDVPAGAQYVGFGLSSGIAYVAYGSTGAASITASSTAATGSEVIGVPNGPLPVIRDLHSTAKTTGISVLAPVAGGLLSLSWYGP